MLDKKDTKDNLNQEIEEGLAQAEKMLRIEKNMSAISEMNIDELPEMALPVYMSLQENIADENWEEVIQLAQALKVLAPKVSVFDQLITEADNKIEQKKQEEERQAELALQKEKDRLRQEQEDMEAQLADTEHKSISSENVDTTKKTPIVMDVVQPQKQSQPKLAWGLTILFGILSLVAGYMYVEANNRADRYYSRYRDEKETNSALETDLEETLDTANKILDAYSAQETAVVALMPNPNYETVFGPKHGSLEHDGDSTINTFLDIIDIENDLGTAMDFMGLDHRDFVITTKFKNPYDAKTNDWDYGILFRKNDEKDKLVLKISSDERWYLYYTDVDGWHKISDGTLKNLGISNGEWNSIVLIAKNKKGYFFLNDKFISVLDLSPITSTGMIDIGSGISSGSTVIGKSTEFSNFTIWALP
jgi:hypothetical protein